MNAQSPSGPCVADAVHTQTPIHIGISCMSERLSFIYQKASVWSQKRAHFPLTKKQQLIIASSLQVIWDRAPSWQNSLLKPDTTPLEGSECCTANVSAQHLSGCNSVCVCVCVCVYKSQHGSCQNPKNQWRRSFSWMAVLASAASTPPLFFYRRIRSLQRSQVSQCATSVKKSCFFIIQQGY